MKRRSREASPSPRRCPTHMTPAFSLRACDRWSGGSAFRRSVATGTRRTAKNSSSNYGSTPAPERALDVTLGVTLGDFASFVALLLAATDRQLELHSAVLEVHARRHERQAFLLH